MRSIAAWSLAASRRSWVGRPCLSPCVRIAVVATTCVPRLVPLLRQVSTPQTSREDVPGLLHLATFPVTRQRELPAAPIDVELHRSRGPPLSLAETPLVQPLPPTAARLQHFRLQARLVKQAALVVPHPAKAYVVTGPHRVASEWQCPCGTAQCAAVTLAVPRARSQRTRYPFVSCWHALCELATCRGCPLQTVPVLWGQSVVQAVLR